ncbi:MAG TPA: outer membrane protein assembly factor BamD [Gemmatimonadales bacterium]|nr:outer membrane protein assembly factor BamD [Gemmatimonadales bacterium]
MRRVNVGAALVALVGAVAMTACGSPKVRTGVTPDVQMSEALALFHRGKFEDALTGFRRIVFELQPGDPALAEARYYSAECQFQEGLLVEAAHAFRDVADQSPESPFAPLALLRAGDANLRTWRDPELDPTPGQTALAIYQELVGRYPGTEAASRAQIRVQELNNEFAAKAYQNGLFYLKNRKAYDSGIIYFKDVIANYPDSKYVAPALLRLAETYAIIGYGDELKEVCGTLRRFHPAEAASARSCPPDSTTSAAH